MFEYLKEYRMEDMRAMMENNRTPHHRSEASLRGKVAVMTGATSGVGRAAAEEFARHGCDLVVVARNREKAEAFADELSGKYGIAVRLYLADLSLLTETRSVADQILASERRIDILVNSAGLHSTRKFHTVEGHELVFTVNHLSSFLMTMVLVPRMKKRPEARIIQVNSQGHRFNGLKVDDMDWNRRLYTGLRGYGASKTAQLLTVWELADRLDGTGVTVNAMHPGEVKSAIGSNNGAFYRWYKEKLLWNHLKDTVIAGESLHYLAADPAVAGVSGIYFNLTHRETPAPHALDRGVGRQVWEKSIAMTGVSDDV